MDYDVIIIGAGPSGSTAAKYLAEQGIKTLLLDKDTFPRYKPCAGGLCNHITQFEYLKPYLTEKSAILQSICRGSITYYPKHQKGYSYHADYNLFYNVYREEFDNLLIDFAKKSGSEFLDNAHVSTVNQQPDHVEITLSNKQKYTANYCIVADGPVGKAGSYVRKNIGVEQKWKKQISLSLVEELPVSSDFIEENYNSHKQAMVYFRYDNLRGYSWVFPKKTSINIGFAGTIDEMKKYDTKKGFQNYIEFLKQKRFLPHDCTSTNMKGGFIPLEGPLKKTYHHRMVLIGDAAGFVSPISGEGIFYAMDSGRIAAQCLAEGLTQQKNPNSIFKSYQKICMDSWGRGLLLLTYFRDFLFYKPSFFLSQAKNDKNLKQKFGALFNGDADPFNDSIMIPYYLSKRFIISKIKK